MSPASRGLAPREGLECLVDEDGPYRPASTATPWAAGRQVWGPLFLERRHISSNIVKRDMALSSEVRIVFFCTR